MFVIVNILSVFIQLYSSMKPLLSFTIVLFKYCSIVKVIKVAIGVGVGGIIKVLDWLLGEGNYGMIGTLSNTIE